MEGVPGKPAGLVNQQYMSTFWPVGVPGRIAAGEATAAEQRCRRESCKLSAAASKQLISFCPWFYFLPSPSTKRGMCVDASAGKTLR